MKVDVEIELPLLPSLPDYGLNGFLPNGYFLEERGTSKKVFFLRCPASTGESIDETISKFLAELHPLEGKLRELKAELRVGVFYDVRETVVFPFRLAKENVSRIASFDLSLDATIYVCSEEK